MSKSFNITSALEQLVILAQSNSSKVKGHQDKIVNQFNKLNASKKHAKKRLKKEIHHELVLSGLYDS